MIQAALQQLLDGRDLSREDYARTVALVSSPSIGIVAGGIIGPLVALLVPKGFAAESAPLDTQADLT